MPKEWWKEESKPDWYWQKYSCELTVSASRKFGLHSSSRQGHDLSLNAQPKLEALLQEKSTYQERAMRFYKAAARKIELRREAEDIGRRLRLMHRALAREWNTWWGQHVQAMSPRDVRALASQLTQVADKYFPER